MVVAVVLVLHGLLLMMAQKNTVQSIKPAEIVIPIQMRSIHQVRPMASAPQLNATRTTSAQNEASKSPIQLKPLTVKQTFENPSETPSTTSTVTSSVKAIELNEASTLNEASLASNHAPPTVGVQPPALSMGQHPLLSSQSSVQTPVVGKSAKNQLPSADAEYNYSRKPKRSIQSEKMGEAGRVHIYVVIGADGELLDAKIDKSSGYPRLDNSALEAVRTWRFKPGMVEGVATALPYLIPITFEP